MNIDIKYEEDSSFLMVDSENEKDVYTFSIKEEPVELNQRESKEPSKAPLS